MLLMNKSVMKCNLILAGFAKCGTSSLHEYLNLHPRICMSSSKEPQYFSKVNRRSLGMSWHDSLFEEDAQYYGESSTMYSVWEPALVRIKQEVHAPKLILILRDPIDRLLSHYRWMYALGLENQGLERALSVEKKMALSPEIHQKGCYPWYRRMSNYSYFVPLIEMIFGDENVLVLSTDELLEHPQRVIDKCFSFLKLSQVSIHQEILSNQTSEKKVPRELGLGWIYRSLPASVRSKVAPIRSRFFRVTGSSKKVAPMPSDEFLEELSKELEEDIQFYRQRVPHLSASAFQG